MRRTTRIEKFYGNHLPETGGNNSVQVATFVGYPLFDNLCPNVSPTMMYIPSKNDVKSWNLWTRMGTIPRNPDFWCCQIWCRHWGSPMTCLNPNLILRLIIWRSKKSLWQSWTLMMFRYNPMLYPWWMHIHISIYIYTYTYTYIYIYIYMIFQLFPWHSDGIPMKRWLVRFSFPSMFDPKSPSGLGGRTALGQGPGVDVGFERPGGILEYISSIDTTCWHTYTYIHICIYKLYIPKLYSCWGTDNELADRG